MEALCAAEASAKFLPDYTTSRLFNFGEAALLFCVWHLKVLLVLYVQQSLVLGGARSSSLQPYSLVHGHQLTVGVSCWYVIVETARKLVRPSVGCCDGVCSNGGPKRFGWVLKQVSYPEDGGSIFRRSVRTCNHYTLMKPKRLSVFI